MAPRVEKARATRAGCRAGRGSDAPASRSIVVRRRVRFAAAALAVLCAAAPPALAVAGRSAARADVDGDGRTDKITFTGEQGAHGTVRVRLAGGRTVRRSVGLITASNPGIVKVPQRDKSRAHEIVIRTQHISTCDTYVVLSYRAGKLRKVDQFCVKGYE